MSKEDRALYMQEYYQKNRKRILARMAELHKKESWRKKHRAYARKYTLELKRKTLTHYGPNGELRCAWPGCFIDDLDELTLDHLNDDGNVHRKTTGFHGSSMYGHLQSHGFPLGFQTLCFNHQVKKHILRLRENRAL